MNKPILTRSDIDMIGDIEGLLSDGTRIDEERARIYLQFLIEKLKAQSGEVCRILKESSEAMLAYAKKVEK